jgi:hypothetical protein
MLCLVKRKFQCFISWTNWPTFLSSHPISQNYSFLYNPGPKPASWFFYCLIKFCSVLAACCHNTAKLIMMYLYWLIPQKCNFS